jgi:hypothetical protein
MKTIIDDADPLDPRFNDAFREYAQARGFVIEPARVRHPATSPGSKCVQYVRSSFFTEDFRDLADCRERAAACARRSPPADPRHHLRAAW